MSAIGWGVNEFKRAFFDRAAIERKAAAGQRRELSKFGAFVRTRARTSIRKRKTSSPPGSPPSSHEGSLRRLILFAFDPDGPSVVVGPARFARGEAPALLERGGTVVRTDRKTGVPRRLHYRGHPFILPAARAELPKFRDTLRGMIS